MGPSFNSDLANVIFGTPADPALESTEIQAVLRLRKALEAASSAQIFKLGPLIDARLLNRLSGRNMLSVAKLVEARSPASIENMPVLRGYREHLRRAYELEQILSPLSLAQTIEALSLGAAEPAA